MTEEGRFHPPPLRVLMALLMPSRAPGHVITPTKLIGRAEDGTEVELRLSDGGRWQINGAEEPRDLGPAELLELHRTQKLHLERAVFVRDIAAILFRAAVEEGQASLIKQGQAERESAGMQSKDEGEFFVAYTLFAGAMDEALRASLKASVLAVAATEAQINAWNSERKAWKGEEERNLSLKRKCLRLLGDQAEQVDLSALLAAARTRNDVMHAKPEEYAFGPNAGGPDLDHLLQGRRACVAVRGALISMARAMQTAAPQYLIYCPPGSPEDDRAWNSAVVLAGTRADPDFPRS